MTIQHESLPGVKFVSHPEFQASEFQSKDQMVQSIEEVLGGERALKAERTRKPKPAKTARERRRRGKGTRLLGEGEDQWAADLALVEPEAGVDRVEWAKQLVHNAVRSPHTQQAYAYALEQFFVWAAGRAISRESVQGYVTWLGEMALKSKCFGKTVAAPSQIISNSDARASF